MCPMRTLVKLLIALSLGAALAGCVVAPDRPTAAAYIGVDVSRAGPGDGSPPRW